MKISRRSIMLFASLAVSAVAVACGGGGDDPATATPRPAATQTPVPATATASNLTGDATRGQELFVTETCSGCHSTGTNPIVGPGLGGISGRAAALGGDAYLDESIRDRNAVIAPGFSAGVMTDFSHLDDQKIADLVAYLNTLP